MCLLSGVPQGSVLGPTLFTMSINHAPSIISSNSTLHADDLKLLGQALSCEDHALLQNSLELLGQWAEAWLLEFKVCQVPYHSLWQTESLLLLFFS